MESSIVEPLQSGAEDLNATEGSRGDLPILKVKNHPTENVVKKRRKKKRIGSDDRGVSSSSSCSSSSTQKWPPPGKTRRKPRVLVSACRRSGGGDVAAIAHPLGMSFAAVIAQVLERKVAAQETLSVDHLSMLCTSAVKESLSNVLGDKFDCFTRNFDKSFGSTLRTLELINELSRKEEGSEFKHLNLRSPSSDETSHIYLKSEVGDSLSNSSPKGYPSEAVLPDTPRSDNASDVIQDEGMTNALDFDLALHGQVNQLACISQRRLGSAINQTMVNTFEKSVVEQTRSNDLKTLELSLSMRKMKLKETELVLSVDSNHIERSKLAMGISKASFKAEKFKNELEDMRYAELHKHCIDFLVAGMLLMSAFLAYGAYVYSYKRITEATASCQKSLEETRSWWVPKSVSSFNSALHMVKCHVQVMSRMLFGFLLFLAVGYLLLQRSTTSRHAMPITFILLLLGVACGFAGKLCVDSLGGSGNHWLLYWETICMLHFLANICTSALFLVLYGPVDMPQEKKRGKVFPYWVRRLIFYQLLVVLPLLCGLMPFAGPTEWGDHFGQQIGNFFVAEGD